MGSACGPSIVGAAVGESFGAAVKTVVGAADGAAVGEVVGAAVGAVVGELVGDMVTRVQVCGESETFCQPLRQPQRNE